MHSLGYSSGGVPPHHAEAIATLRDTAIGLRANSHGAASNGWARQLSASSLMEFNHVATSFLKLTDQAARERAERKPRSRSSADRLVHTSQRVTDQVHDQDDGATEAGMLPLLEDPEAEENAELGFPLNLGSPR